MDLLPCAHLAAASDSRVCIHLVAEEPPDYVRWLTGIGVRYDLLCAQCANTPDPQSLLIEACVGCVERVEERRDPLGWRGQPEIRYHDGDLSGAWTYVDCAYVPMNDRCLAALPDGWLAATGAGLVAITDDGDRVIAPTPTVVEPTDETSRRAPRPALYTSADGRFAAMVNDYGRQGAVVDLRTGSVVLRVDRGDYHCDLTPFPFAFLGSGPHTVVIAGTDWNRLDAFEPKTGQLLTDRDFDWDHEQPGSIRDANYFHGALLSSPSGRWLLDDGWVWSPFGVPRVIDAAGWLNGEVYTAEEHGITLSQRGYAWDQPMAWIDDHRVAIQRIGVDDEAMIDGVELFAVPSGQRTGMFAGPTGRMWAYNRLLYVSAVEGLEVWDPVAGARIGLLKDFRPTAHNPHTGAFAEPADRRLDIWRPTG
ncbi:YncE family protein [Nocardia brasiliensis]|uniref:YncE family protein n=1 Tax=Nocardia brasiliensis TaxID=37326 RepID=UPI003670A54F